MKEVLVFIKPVVQDILHKRRKMKDLKLLQKSIQSERINNNIEHLGKEIMYHLKELESVGYSIKNLETGEYIKNITF